MYTLSDCCSPMSGLGQVWVTPTQPGAAKPGDLWYDPLNKVWQQKLPDGSWGQGPGGGGAITWATEAEILAGTVADHAIAPDQLRLHTLAAPTATPVNDADHIIRLDPAGLVDLGFLPNAVTPDATPANDANKVVTLGPAGQINVGFIPGVAAPGATPAANAGRVLFLSANGLIDPALINQGNRGTVDATGANVPAGVNPGDFVVNNTAGNPDAAWAGLPPAVPLGVGDILIWDGTAWHNAGASPAATGFLPLAGGHMLEFADVFFDVPAGAAPPTPPVRIDGVDPAKSAIDNFTVAAGAVALPTLAPITVAVANVGGAGADVTFGGGPADKAYTVTFTYQFNGVGVNTIVMANVQLHDTPDMVANRAVNAFRAALGHLVAVKAGVNAVNIQLGTATVLDSFTAVVA